MQHIDNKTGAITLITRQRMLAKQMEKKVETRANTNWLSLRVVALCLFIVSVSAPFVAQETHRPAIAPRPVAVAKPLIVSNTASLVTEFEVNGLKVLVKRREGNQTAVA